MTPRLRRALALLACSILACAVDAVAVHFFGTRAYGGIAGNMLVALCGAWVWEGGK